MGRELRKLTLLLLTSFLFLATLHAQESAPIQTPEGGPVKAKQVLAIVDGHGILADELLPLVRPQLRQLRSQEYEIESKALENLITQKLLEAEAKKKGIAKEKLFEQEVDPKIAEPTDSEVAAYYLGQRGGRPLEEVKDQVRTQLKQAKIQQAREKYVQDLREKAEVTVLLRPPKVQVSFDAARLRGDPKAPITIVEFSDFQCPYCRKVQPALKELLAKHPEVKLAYRDFPLRDIHPQAQAAAEASRCAEEQGKFWEYHDALFAAPKLDHDAQLEMARSLHLDEQKFEACLSSGKYRERIEQDLQAGTQAGVSGTPGFFVNGIALSGTQPVSAFEKIIASELAVSNRAKQPAAKP